jgi:fermentation-respiration switch protein FrsA (DUF1100 family)
MGTASVASLLASQGRARRFLLSRACRLAIAVALVYGLSCVGLYGTQRYLVFEPDTTLRTAPADYPFPVQDIALAGEPRQTLHGWWVAAPNPRAKVVLYLHGNDGNVSTNMDGIVRLRELGYSVFLIDYRGYGASDGGFPSEQGVYRDAQAAWDYLVRERGVNPVNLVIYGHSLGGAIAIELALHHPEAAALVVESSFTSIRDLARLDERYAVIPVGLFLNQRFDSIAKVGRLRVPVLYIHGTADEIVPFEMGKALYDATPAAHGFVAVRAGGHENGAVIGGAELRSAIGRFVENAARKPRPESDRVESLRERTVRGPGAGEERAGVGTGRFRPGPRRDRARRCACPISPRGRQRDGGPGPAAGGALARHRLGDPAPVRGGHRRRDHLRHDVHAAAPADPLSLFRSGAGSGMKVGLA